MEKYVSYGDYDMDVASLFRTLKRNGQTECENLSSENFMEDIFKKKKNAIVIIPRISGWRRFFFFLEDIWMNRLEKEVCKIFRTRSKTLSHLGIVLLKHANGKYFIRFRRSQLNSLTGLDKLRYNDLLLRPIRNGYELLLPYSFFTFISENRNF